jgi:hypothetical protein
MSLVSERDCPKIAAELGIEHLHIAIEDNPYEDLIMCLEGLNGWIENALNSGAGKHVVLVHCLQGQSRSGAVVVAYLMRALSFDYDAALSLARKYHAASAPNPGFADQLRLWQELQYSIFISVPGGEGGGMETKAEYEAWKDGRGVLLSRLQEERSRALMKQVASMAALFSARNSGVQGSTDGKEE